MMSIDQLPPMFATLGGISILVLALSVAVGFHADRAGIMAFGIAFFVLVVGFMVYLNAYCVPKQMSDVYFTPSIEERLQK